MLGCHLPRRCHLCLCLSHRPRHHAHAACPNACQAHPPKPGSTTYNEQLWRHSQNEKIIGETQTQAEIAAQCQWDRPVSTFHATGAPLKVSLHALHTSAPTSHHDSHSPRPVCVGPPHGRWHWMGHLLHFTCRSGCPHAPHALPHTSLPSLVRCDPGPLQLLLPLFLSHLSDAAASPILSHPLALSISPTNMVASQCRCTRQDEGMEHTASVPAPHGEPLWTSVRFASCPKACLYPSGT